jgi:16S rRNA processing protein RimM
MAVKKIGTVVNTYGLKGMVKISLSTSRPEDRFAVGKKVKIKNQMNEETDYVIDRVLFKNSRIVYVGFKPFQDINDVEWMIGREVQADVRTRKGTFFYDDLVGMAVVSDKGESLGTVVTVLTMPAGEYLELEENVLVPYQPDRFVAYVDKKKRIIGLTALGTETVKSVK